MLEHGPFGAHLAPPPGSRVGAIASQALSVLVSRRTCRRVLCESHLAALRDGVLNGDREARLRIVEEMSDDGIDAASVCDHYIPEVARRLGGEWCEDATSFAQVTIGSARLQSLLRDIEPGPSASTPDDGRRIAVIVPEDEHHTLGAMVLTGLLRRRGLSVRLVLGRDAEGVADAVWSERPDAALISVAPRDGLGAIRALVAAMRRGYGGPVLVGGGILARGPDRVLRETGADHATCDIEAMLRLCPQSLPDDVLG